MNVDSVRMTGILRRDRPSLIPWALAATLAAGSLCAQAQVVRPFHVFGFAADDDRDDFPDDWRRLVARRFPPFNPIRRAILKGADGRKGPHLVMTIKRGDVAVVYRGNAPPISPLNIYRLTGSLRPRSLVRGQVQCEVRILDPRGKLVRRFLSPAFGKADDGAWRTFEIVVTDLPRRSRRDSYFMSLRFCLTSGGDHEGSADVGPLGMFREPRILFEEARPGKGPGPSLPGSERGGGSLFRFRPGTQQLSVKILGAGPGSLARTVEVLDEDGRSAAPLQRAGLAPEVIEGVRVDAVSLSLARLGWYMVRYTVTQVDGASERVALARRSLLVLDRLPFAPGKTALGLELASLPGPGALRALLAVSGLRQLRFPLSSGIDPRRLRLEAGKAHLQGVVGPAETAALEGLLDKHGEALDSLDLAGLGAGALARARALTARKASWVEQVAGRESIVRILPKGDERARRDDLARRVVLAARQAPRIFVGPLNTGHRRPGLLRDGDMLEPVFPTLRLVANLLDRARYRGAILLGEGIDAHLFETPQGVWMAYWSDRGRRGEAYLGEGLEEHDLLGNRIAARVDAGKLTMDASRLVRFLTGIDDRLLRTQQTLDLELPTLDSSISVQKKTLKITNHFDRKAEFRIFMRFPSDWRYRPIRTKVSLDPGASGRIPLEFNLPAGVLAGKNAYTVDVEIVYEGGKRFFRAIKLIDVVPAVEAVPKVFLEDISRGRGNVVVQLTNRSEGSLSVYVYMLAAERSVELAPGARRPLRFAVADFAQLAGRRVRLALREDNGPRVSNRDYRFVVRGTTVEMVEIPPFKGNGRAP